MHEIKASEITFLLVQKVFLCIEELTRHEAMKLTFSVLPCCHHVKSVADDHFDLFIYYLNPTDVMSKVTVRKGWYLLFVFNTVCYGYWIFAKIKFSWIS